MSLLNLVEKAGVVGCGGAGFPAHIKWKTKAEYLIVNAAECEPLLDTDKYLMRHRAQDLVNICNSVAELIEASQIVIAVKGTYRKEIEAVNRAIASCHARIRLHELESFYPAGDEQIVVQEVTGRVVPCGGIPLDVGVVVSNVATLIAAFDAERGIPLIEKYVTVAGEVKNPSVIKVPIGTSITECIDAVGGPTMDNYLIIAGGPMMGKELSSLPEDQRRISKTTSGILVLPKKGMLEKYKEDLDLLALRKKARTSCIQCSFCTMLCPRHLLGHPLSPHRIMRAISWSEDMEQLLEDEYVRNASLCSLCGVCTAYACPIGLQPSKVNAFLKTEMQKRGIKRDKKEITSPQTDRDWRKVPTGRISARIGVGTYAHKVQDQLITITPLEVAIALKQSIGRLPEIIVGIGDTVKKGDLIGSVDDGVMGTNLHASIDGVITEITDVIKIRRQE